MTASWSKIIQSVLAWGPHVLFLPTKQSARPIYSHDNATWKSSIPGPAPWAAARTAPNGVKERASFCLVFRSLNTTSSHRKFSMGYRRGKSTRKHQLSKKEYFDEQLRDHYPRALIAQIDQGARKETKTFASFLGYLVVKVNDAKTTRKQSKCSAYDNTKRSPFVFV